MVYLSPLLHTMSCTTHITEPPSVPLPPSPSPPHPPCPQVLADDSHLLAACEDRDWTIWDLHQEKLRSLFRGDMGAVRGLALAPDQVRGGVCVWGGGDSREWG
jgi:hypothetical protein